MQAFSPSPPARREARAGQTPRAAPAYGSCQPKEDEAPLPQPAPPSGEAAAGLESPQASAFDGRPPGPAATLCPLRGLQLKAREKERSRHRHLAHTHAVPSPSPPAPRKPRQARHTTSCPHSAYTFEKGGQGTATSPVPSSGSRGPGGKPRQARSLPSPSPPPGRLPRFAGSSLGPEKKDEAPPPRPSPSPGPQEPAAATAGWTLAGISAPVCTSTHLCHHRAFRGRGGGGCVCVEPRQARIPAPPPPRGPPAFECRRPPPAAGLRPAPRGERLYPSHRSPTADGACRWLRLSLTPPAPRTHRLGLSGKNRGTAVTNRRKKRAKPPGDTA